MSNLSDIGFPIGSNEELNKLIESWLQNAAPIPASKGFYLKYSDQSGAEIYLQMNHSEELMGFNPFFAGKSQRNVFVSSLIERDTSEMDGGFYVWANGTADGKGDYPFVFDVPDIFSSEIALQTPCEIQLNAFATNDLEMFASEEEFNSSQQSEPKFAMQSFIPIGLFGKPEGVPPQAHGKFSGIVKEFDVKVNTFTGKKFYWFLAETLGGDIDIVSDPAYIKKEPQVGSILSGSFWLTGKVIKN